MRRAAVWAALALGVGLSLTAGAVAYRLANYSWGQVAEYRSPYLGAKLPTATAPPPQTDRLVLVIVDGLRLDASRRMAGLNTLRQYGTDLALTVPQPSLSYPNWTTILSGCPQRFSGVTTNAYDRRVSVETLIDTALGDRRKVVVVGPDVMKPLYGAQRAQGTYFRTYVKGVYLSGDLVQHAIALTRQVKPSLVVVHLPDVDEAGHHSGGGSQDYANTVAHVDRDLSVLFNYLQDPTTTFVVGADHGHIAAGGHGGWEREAVDVPGVFAGAGVGLGKGTGKLEDVAPTAASLLGIATPRNSVGRILSGVISGSDPAAEAAVHEQRARAMAGIFFTVLGKRLGLESVRPFEVSSYDQQDALVERADAQRLGLERSLRQPLALGVALGALAVLAAIGLLSWRALVAALAGTAAYYAVYETLFFGVHRYAWSLSVINSEDRLQAFFNGRLAEAALAGLVAAAVSGYVYPLLRKRPKSARGRYLSGWLSLGPATVLAVQATLAVQVAWYLLSWGARVTWILPDLRLAFKYDLDLLQVVALGGAAVLSPLVTLLVGRYHPRVAGQAPKSAPRGDEE